MEETQSSHAAGDDRSRNMAETLRTLRAQADQTLEGHRRRVSHIEAELNLRLRQISEELARDRVAEEMETSAVSELQLELQGLQEALEESAAEHESLRAQLDSQAREEQAQLDERDEEVGQLIEQFDQSQTERDALAKELQEQQDQSAQIALDLETAQQCLEDLRQQECADCAQLREDLGAQSRLCTEQEARSAQLVLDLAAAEQCAEDLRQQECADCAQLREDLGAQALRCAEQEAKCADLGDQFTAARETLESEHQEQLQRINRKFELALADVHKLKRENAELHSELASRPAASDVESPELLSLRSERDALAARLTQLENAAPQAVDTDVQQDIADLQRRFELAVDDVRLLKQENADLLGQLEATSAPADPGDATGTDWQSQKARLMEALDAEEQGTLTPQRRQDLATIEGTISLTDQIVAAKDEELAQMRASLEARPAEEDLQAVEEMKQAVREEIFSDDQLIQTERKRLEEIQQEWQDKLRQAELEISVERAKLAREQSELAVKLASLQDAKLEEKQDDGQPRRRWLSALGLRDDED